MTAHQFPNGIDAMIGDPVTGKPTQSCTIRRCVLTAEAQNLWRVLQSRRGLYTHRFFEIDDGTAEKTR
jgi:hypothetical protein